MLLVAADAEVRSFRNGCHLAFCLRITTATIQVDVYVKINPGATYIQCFF